MRRFFTALSIAIALGLYFFLFWKATQGSPTAASLKAADECENDLQACMAIARDVVQINNRLIAINDSLTLELLRERQFNGRRNIVHHAVMASGQQNNGGVPLSHLGSGSGGLVGR